MTGSREPGSRTSARAGDASIAEDSTAEIRMTPPEMRRPRGWRVMSGGPTRRVRPAQTERVSDHPSRVGTVSEQQHRNKSGFETRAIHAGYEPDPMTGSVIPPIYATSTYKQDGVGGLRGGYEYSRSANPTRTALEGNIAALEEGERGFAFASGLAAEDTLIRATCRPSDHAVIPDDAYGGTFRLFDKVEQVWGLEHSPVPVSDVDAVRDAILPGSDEAGLGRDPDQPAAQHRRHRGPGRRRPRGRSAARRGQHVRVAVPPAAAGARRRRGAALHHEVLRRPLRRHRRRDRGPRPRAGREADVPPERHGRRGRALRLLAGAARAEDPRHPDGPALRQRRADRRLPERPPAGHPGALPGPARPPRPQDRGAADEALRRHGVLPRRRRREAGARRSATTPRCSPSASRSAASSR